MVAVNLDTKREKQLELLASAEGKPVAEFARKVIEDYLDLLALGELSDEEWAEGCAALSPEVFPPENWDEETH